MSDIFKKLKNIFCKFDDSEIEKFQNLHFLLFLFHSKHKIALNTRMHTFGQSVPDMYIFYPQISRYQWHPFSIVNAPGSNFGNLEFKISALGDWTKALDAAATAHKEQKSGNDEIKINENILTTAYVYGPFGTFMKDLKNYKYVIFIATGIGNI